MLFGQAFAAFVSDTTTGSRHKSKSSIWSGSRRNYMLEFLQVKFPAGANASYRYDFSMGQWCHSIRECNGSGPGDKLILGRMRSGQRWEDVSNLIDDMSTRWLGRIWNDLALGAVIESNATRCRTISSVTCFFESLPGRDSGDGPKRLWWRRRLRLWNFLRERNHGSFNPTGIFWGSRHPIYVITLFWFSREEFLLLDIAFFGLAGVIGIGSHLYFWVCHEHSAQVEIGISSGCFSGHFNLGQGLCQESCSWVGQYYSLLIMGCCGWSFGFLGLESFIEYFHCLL